jgi:HAD superfamily hydrolase (TIGR01509 family)
VIEAGRLQAVVFDFDGLILDTEWPEYQSISETFADHGHDFPLEGWVEIVGTASSPSWLDLLEERVGAPIEREAVRARRVERHHALIAEREVLPGVVARLEEARALGIPLAVASSSPHGWVEGHLTRLGLVDHFGSFHCYDGRVPGKPAPDLYLAAVAALDADPARSIAFEDSANGVTAAKAAGLYAVAVPNQVTAGLDFSHADLVVESLADVSLEDLARTMSP